LAVPGRITLNIDGRVVHGSDGSNVVGARVMLTDNRGSIRGLMHTRDGGSFQFVQMNPGRYTLSVWHQDYVEHSETIDLMLSSVTGLLVRLAKQTAPPKSMQGSVPAWALTIPEKAQEQFNRGLAALERSDGQRAVRHMQRAVEIYPQFAAAYAAMGNAQQMLKESEEATKSFNRALEIDDTLYAAWLGLGTLHSAAGRHQDAERCLLKARTLRTEDWQAWYQLGELYWEMKDAPHTEENARRALQMHGSMPRIHILLINALVVQEKYRESLAAMEEFLAKFPRSPLAPEVARKRDLLRAELARIVP
jgi:tetratricopeptide (TPR) repeat protein